MLTVTCPPTYEPERRYALHVVLRERLGLEHRVQFSDSLRGEIQIAAGSGFLRIADVLFATPVEEWLTPQSLPRPPFREHPTGRGGRRVPVVLGSEPFDDDGSFFPVDVFGTAFLLLTRYEELANPAADQWGRYPSDASLAGRAGFMQQPIVDEWVEELWRRLTAVWPRLERPQRRPRIVLTHDVDLPYSPDYSLSRVARAAWGDVWRRRHPTLAARRLASKLAALGGRRTRDPFDTFDFIMDTSERHGLSSYFFFIAGHVGDPFAAPAYEIADRRTRALLRRIAGRGHQIGLHPSFNASVVAGQTKHEFDTLRRVCAEEGITQASWGSRQHYLRWFNPGSWRECAEAGLSFDSTLVYADQPGFRAGTCHAYPVFDLERQEMLPLQEVPLIVMEDSLLGRRYRGLADDEALATFVELKEACFRVGGDFVLLWHNSELVSRARRELYTRLLAAFGGDDPGPVSIDPVTDLVAP